MAVLPPGGVQRCFDDVPDPRRFNVTHAQPPPLTGEMGSDNGHGRPDERAVWARGEVGWLKRRHDAWTDLRGIACVEGRWLDFATGHTSVPRRDCATRLDPREVGVERLGALVRGHWSIENQLHWSLGMSCSDDACLIKTLAGGDQG